MGRSISLKAKDGHTLSAYEAVPDSNARGGIIVVQEIFGVNKHIRAVADGFAAAGYRVIAPAFFDRVARGVDLGYTESDIAQGLKYYGAMSFDTALLDVEAALREASSVGHVGIVGYCWGGTVTWLSAARVKGLAAASSYYGGGIGHFAKEKPLCATQLHFGDRDDHIPLSEVEAVRAAQPGVEVYVYRAGHGFNCSERPSYNRAAATEAQSRTLAHFKKHIG